MGRGADDDDERTVSVVQQARDGAAVRGLVRPQALDALQQLARLLGPAEALQAWAQAAASAGHHGTDLSPEALLEVAEALRPSGALQAVFATSLSARVRAWQVLSRTTGGPS